MELNIQEIDNPNLHPNIVILNDIPNIDQHKSQNEFKNIKEKKTVSTYDEILSKMGMYVENGKITLIDNKKQVSFVNNNSNNNNNKCTINNDCSKIKCTKLQQSMKQLVENNNRNISPSPQNSYIYNKYFKNQPLKEPKENIPLTKDQIIQKLINNRIQRQRIRQIKSTKLIMPTENIHIAPEQNLNRLFGFSQRKI